MQFFDSDGDGIVSEADLSRHLVLKSLPHLARDLQQPSATNADSSTLEEVFQEDMNLGEHHSRSCCCPSPSNRLYSDH